MACPVCFTGDDPVVRESLTAGIGVLVGITLVVLSGFASFFIVLARRARLAARESAQPADPLAARAPRVVAADVPPRAPGPASARQKRSLDEPAEAL